MPLIKAAMKAQIQSGIASDPVFKAKVFKLAKESMDNFQSAQKQAQMNAGSLASFVVAQKVASIAFAKKFEGIQPLIADVVAKHVSNSVDSYIKLGQVIIPAPLTSTPAAIGAPVLIPVVPPGKLI